MGSRMAPVRLLRHDRRAQPAASAGTGRMNHSKRTRRLVVAAALLAVAALSAAVWVFF